MKANSSIEAAGAEAQVLLDEGRAEEALAAVERSIRVLSENEDVSRLADATWIKCACLLRLDRVAEAIVLFAELTELAGRKIDRAAVDKYTALFAEEIYVLKQFPLPDEVAAFKRSQVIKAMRESGGHVANAAEALGLRSQQHLSEILNNQFPDIYDELEIKRRARRSNAGSKKTAPSPVPAVTPLTLARNCIFSFNFALTGSGHPRFFRFSKEIMRKEFGVRTDAVVAVMPADSESLYEGTPVLYIKDGAFRVGKFSFDEFSGLFLVDLEEFTFLSDVKLLGTPVGYCPASERDNDLIKFEPLRFVK